MTGTRKRVACAATLAVTAALAGLFFMWESPAKPAEKRTAAAAEAATEETNGGFRMLDGASVRLSKDGDFYGIRFGAKVEDATKRYAMLIVPATLAAGYEQGKETGETLSEYCERRAEEAGGRVAKAEELTADAENEISCALVNVRWENLNRAFSGIAYYETEDGRSEAGGRHSGGYGIDGRVIPRGERVAGRGIQRDGYAARIRGLEGERENARPSANERGGMEIPAALRYGHGKFFAGSHESKRNGVA